MKRVEQLMSVRRLLVAGLLLACSCLTVEAQTSKYDVNEDGKVDIVDVTTLIDYILGKIDESSAPAGVKAVDLGLPSGTKWANMNVGAEKEEDYGLYFAWGETVGYSGEGDVIQGHIFVNDGRKFSWDSYKWMKEGQKDWKQICKYQRDDRQTSACWYDNDGQFIGDGFTELALGDDAANQNWGGSWRMLTYTEMRELIDNTTQEDMTVNGVRGCKLTSTLNGNSIFLPYAGLRRNQALEEKEEKGDYWTSTLYLGSSGDSRYAYYFLTSDRNNKDRFTGRFLGLSVRPVIKK